MRKTWHDIENTKKRKCWKDDVDEMHRALEKEGIGSSVMEMFFPAKLNGMAEARDNPRHVA